MKPLDVFIQGENLDLCVPNESFAEESDWYSWFNQPSVTRYLEQGLFPNTPSKQVEFLKSTQQDRLTLIISDKAQYIGVISLSSVNLIKKKCQIAIVLSGQGSRKMQPYISLEAMARISEHAFTVMGIERIEAGQHTDLRGWQQRMELIGYKVEGLHRDKFIKGRELADSVSIACLFRDYEKIIAHRGGYWDGAEAMRSRYKKLPKVAYVDMLRMFVDQQGKAYYEDVFSL